MYTHIETTAHLILKRGELVRLFSAAKAINSKTKCKDMDDAAKLLAARFSKWHVHRGKNHIALSQADGDFRRLLIVVPTQKEGRMYEADDLLARARAGTLTS